MIAALTMAAVVALLLLDPGNGDGSASDTQNAGDTGTSGTDDGSGTDSGTSDDPGSGGDTETDPAETPPTTPEDNSGSGSGEQEDPDAPVVPEGYTVFRDSEYKVALPDGWTITEETETRKVYSDPDTGRYLLLEEGGEPNGDPYKDWVRQETYFSDTIPGYELLGIERVDYRDFDAADWEFMRDSDWGRMHIRNRAVVDGDQAFALYWAAPEDDWEASLPVFEDIAASFEPLG